MSAIGEQSVGALVERPVAERLDAVPLFAGRTLELTPLTGGLTNQNYRVDVDGHSYVARLSNPSGSLLAIDRRAEHANSIAAAESGVAPGVAGFVVEAGVLVVDWVEGRTLTAADVREDATLVRIARACRQLHSGPRFVNDFDMFVIQRRYLQVVTERGLRLPERYLDYLPMVERLRTALAVRRPAAVPCNNDLLAANVIDSGDRLWLIDYEYAGNNEACFELGNLWSESGLEVDQLELLVESYFGRPSPSLVARARLQALMAQYGWTLWASIQDGLSTLDFDFWSWGMEKYARAEAEFSGSDLPRLLEGVTQSD